VLKNRDDGAASVIPNPLELTSSLVVHESQGLKHWTVPTRPKDHYSRLH
jgi:hypothetical protein